MSFLAFLMNNRKKSIKKAQPVRFLSCFDIIRLIFRKGTACCA